MKKHIGVVTIIDVDNYGNRLQNYALCRILEKFGNDVNTAVFLSPVQKKIFIRMYLRFLLMSKRRKEANRNKMFYEFGKETIKYCFINNKKKFDFYICGSDQIWHPGWYGDDLMYANFATNNKRISYAASFGVNEIPDDKKDFVSRSLKEMKCISVREEAGAKIVKELTGRDAEVLVDPTFLLNKSEWQKISKKPEYNTDKKYILTYFLGEMSKESITYIEKLSKDSGYEIINLESKHKNNFWYTTGPAEFIWLIENCELMCTDSFHGSVFSIIMEVPFLVFERKDNLGSMYSRIDTLLKKLNLIDRKFKYQNIEKAFDKNYDHIPSILNKEKKLSILYLKNALLEED